MSRDLAQKESLLRRLVRRSKKLMVAFSGGVDSSLLAFVATQELGNDALIVLADSPSLASENKEEAEKLAEAFGFHLRVVGTKEHKNPDYLRNQTDRCALCKGELYRRLRSIAPEEGIDVITDGSHMDDSPVDRPGNKALVEFGIRSLLREAELGKKDIRRLARGLGLPNHDKPADACLASRFLTGTPIDLGQMRVVALAERFLKEQGIRVVRLRLRSKEPLLELDEDSLRTFHRNEPTIRQQLAKLGFKEVRLNPKPLVR